MRSSLFFYLRPYAKHLVLGLISVLIFGVTSALPSYLFRFIIDDVLIMKNGAKVFPFTGAILLLFFLKCFFMYLSHYQLAKGCLCAVNDMRKAVFTSVLFSPISFFKQEKSSTIVSHLTYDLHVVYVGLLSIIKQGIRSFFEAIFLVAIAFWQQPFLTLLVCTVSPLLAYVIGRVGKTVRSAAQSMQKEMAHLGTVVHELFLGSKEIKIMRGEGIEEEKFNIALLFYEKVSLLHLKAEAGGPALTEGIGLAAIVGVCTYAFFDLFSGKMSPGQLTCVCTSLLFAYQPIKRLVAVWADVQTVKAALERVEPFLEKRKSLTLSIKDSPSFSFNKSIRLSTVSFGYENGKDIFSEVNLTIRPGERIAIIGPSGSGKSTLCDLLMGLVVPTKGNMYVDDVLVDAANRVQLVQLFSYVNQSPFLFNDTIYNNVVYGLVPPSAQAVLSVCEKAYVHDFARALPQKYMTQVGENGSCLSGGQKQRITIARALLAGRQIIILDECTSALDPLSEEHIVRTLSSLDKKTTVLVITHKPWTVPFVDTFYLLDEGRLMEKPIQEIKKQPHILI